MNIINFVKYMNSFAITELYPCNLKTVVCVCRCVLSHISSVWLFMTLWTVALQAPLSMRFSRQEYWSGLPCSPPRDLPDPGIEPMSLTSPALAGGLSPPGKPTIIITTQKSFFFIQKYILSTFFLGIGSIRMNKKKSAVLKVLTQQKDIKL